MYRELPCEILYPSSEAGSNESQQLSRMPRCLGAAKSNNNAMLTMADEEAIPLEVDAGVLEFWSRLSHHKRRDLLSVNRKRLFTRIREQFCSRCFGEPSAMFRGISG